MAGIYDVYQIPEVRKDNPLQTHFDQNQLLKEAVATGKITPEQYNILGGYDVQKNLTPGNPILGGIVNLGASIPYNIYQSIKTDQPFSDVFGDVYRNVKGGLGLFSPELKTAYNDIMAGKTPQNVTQLANKNFIDTIGNMVFTTANADAIPTEIEKQSVERGVQDFDLESVRDIISQMEEEKSNYIERPENRFNMDGILENLGGYAKDAAGRYIGSQALSGAGGMLFGPIGALVGGIFGALKGGDLFNQNTYSQQMYNNLTPGGQAYANSLYAPGGLLQGYNQISAFGTGPLGLISKNLSRYGETMSPARRNAYLDAANRLINSQDYSKTGIAAVTKTGTHAYDDVTKYIQPSNGDSGSSWSGGTGGFGQGFSTSSSGTEETF